MPFAGYQNDVYLRAAQTGEFPTLPFGWCELQESAEQVMTPGAVGYVSGSAGGESTHLANRNAFDHWQIVPRYMRGIPAVRDLSTTLFGKPLPAPVLLAPVGVLSIVHDEAETAVSRAAAAVGLPMIVSTASSTPMEQVREGLGTSSGWFQLYWPDDKDVAQSLVQRAEAAGYDVLVLTVDTWQLGWRPRDLSRAYLPFLNGLGIANYTSDPAFRAGLSQSPEADPQAAILHFLGMFTNSLTFADLTWLRNQTSLPIVLKGLQHPDDVRRAIDGGVDGVVCSNHGGRQVDGAVGALDVLPDLIAAAMGEIPILFDSGIRTGADAVKALALGASAVLLGRPWVYGLALGGQAGVEHVLRSFLADLDLQLGLSGHARPSDLAATSLRRSATANTR